MAGGIGSCTGLRTIAAPATEGGRPRRARRFPSSRRTGGADGEGALSVRSGERPESSEGGVRNRFVQTGSSRSRPPDMRGIFREGRGVASWPLRGAPSGIRTALRRPEGARAKQAPSGASGAPSGRAKRGAEDILRIGAGGGKCMRHPAERARGGCVRDPPGGAGTGPGPEPRPGGLRSRQQFRGHMRVLSPEFRIFVRILVLMQPQMEKQIVVRLRNAAIYHADNPFGSCSPANSPNAARWSSQT